MKKTAVIILLSAFAALATAGCGLTGESSQAAQETTQANTSF